MADLEFRLLGPLEVVRDRVPVALPPGLPRAVLGRLLLSLNSVVATDRLIEDLWRGDPPVSAGQALRVYISNLRRLLEPDRAQGRPPRVLVTRPPGYLLAAEPCQTDAGRFELLVAEGASAFDEGRVAEASASFAEALRLWRGPVLADLGDEPFVGPETARLEELRLVATDRWAETELALGHHRQLVGELEALVRLHPFQERLWAQLIVALYRSGRQADALQTYQRLRTLLADELGLEPSPPLRQLEAAVLRHDPDLDVPAGITAPAVVLGPVATMAVRPEAERGFAQLARMPFVGRQKELLRLSGRWVQAVEGKGNLVLIAGEPGIGKTRLTEELAEQVTRDGGVVLWGRCFEGEWMPPYAPFASALEALARPAEAEALRADLGVGAPALVQLVPAFRQVLPDVPDASPLPPDEERFRLQDAMVRFLAARSERAPILCCLDDLHWADTSSIGALRHFARLVGRHRILILGTYRDAEVGRDHPLALALGALHREAEYDRVHLEGLGPDAVGDLLATLAEHDVDEAVAAVVARETEGNPFFIREVLRHLVEEGRIRRGSDGRWTSELPAQELGIPEGVRQVIRRRLARLSRNANRLLGAACSFEGPFRLQVAAGAADLGEEESLDALDEALEAQLLDPAGATDCYAFTHALVRHTLYEELSPSRRARLHQRVAVDLEAAAGPSPSPAELGEIAVQYHRSAGLPGGEGGIAPALAAAAYAEENGGQREAARFLRLALDLLPAGDARRPRLLGRLGMALIWGLASDDGAAVAGEAGQAIAAAEGPDAAADYLAEAAAALGIGANNPLAWELARQGLRHAGDRRDLTWARLVQLDHFRRETQDAENPGIPIETPERWEAARIIRTANPDPVAFGGWETPLASRAEALTSRNLVVRMAWAGEYAACLPAIEAVAREALLQDRIIRAARATGGVAFCHLALGNLAAGQAALEEGERLAARIGTPLFVTIHAREVLAVVLDEDEHLERVAETCDRLPAGLLPAQAWALGPTYAISARTAARLGRGEVALGFLKLLVPWLERAPGWSTHFTVVATYAAETLWWLERLDHAALVEQALREKVIDPDFRDPMVDGRLALARLCALHEDRSDEAASWFAKARKVLSEQGARPLLAITDHDEAVMYARRGSPGDIDRARTLIQAAREQFEAIGMTGWTRRADALRRRLS